MLLNSGRIILIMRRSRDSVESARISLIKSVLSNSGQILLTIIIQMSAGNIEQRRREDRKRTLREN